MLIKNTRENFGIISIILHWVMALLIIGLLILGLYMVRVPISSWKLKLYGWHKEFGLMVLALAIVRICWRVLNTTPSLSELPTFERVAARAAHWLFYVFMFALPITGWMVTSSSGLPVSFFGWFVLPDFVAVSEEGRQLYSEIHKWLAYGLIFVLCGHIGAALQHHFINKDTILRRMLWPQQ